MRRYLVFLLDDLRLALDLCTVNTVTPMVYVTALPSAPDIVLGVVNLRGQVIPVIDIRKRFNLAPREIALTDRLVFARTKRRPLALAVNGVIDVVEGAFENMVSMDEVLPAMPYIEGIMKFQEGLIFIHDLAKFLNLKEEECLDSALASI